MDDLTHNPLQEFFENQKKHFDFIVKDQFGHWEVWLVHEITGELRERFGLYNKWWQAERAARKYQKWADAERWS